MKRFAFTMLELVFIIIVIGILAVLAMPSFNRHPLQEAAEQVARHIRYTQHLAMLDDKFDPSDENWSRENWQLEFKHIGATIYYEIYSDNDHKGNSDVNETALDPLSHQLMDGSTNITDLTKNFAIKTVLFSLNCKPSPAIGEIDFDFIGRPYYYITGNTSGVGVPLASNIYQYKLNSDCVITLVHETDGNATITVHPETGYISVQY